MDTLTRQQRALDRSRELDPDLMRTSKVRPGVYSVLGETAWREVRVDAGGYSCDCEAGANRQPCWHAASAFRMRLAVRALRPTQLREAA